MNDILNEFVNCGCGKRPNSIGLPGGNMGTNIPNITTIMKGIVINGDIGNVLDILSAAAAAAAAVGSVAGIGNLINTAIQKTKDKQKEEEKQGKEYWSKISAAIISINKWLVEKSPEKQNFAKVWCVNIDGKTTNCEKINFVKLPWLKEVADNKKAAAAEKKKKAAAADNKKADAATEKKKADAAARLKNKNLPPVDMEGNVKLIWDGAYSLVSQKEGKKKDFKDKFEALYLQGLGAATESFVKSCDVFCKLLYEMYIYSDEERCVTAEDGKIIILNQETNSHSKDNTNNAVLSNGELKKIGDYLKVNFKERERGFDNVFRHIDTLARDFASCPNNKPNWTWTEKKEKKNTKNTWWLPSSRASKLWNPPKKGPKRPGAKIKKTKKSKQCKDFK